MPRKLVDSELAAIYWAMLHHPDRPLSLVTKQETDKAKRTIYELAKTQRIKNYGTAARGQARWDLVELYRAHQSRK